MVKIKNVNVNAADNVVLNALLLIIKIIYSLFIVIALNLIIQKSSIPLSVNISTALYTYILINVKITFLPHYI